MKLIGSLTSPYVRKVRAVLAEKKIEYSLLEQSPWAPEATVVDFNPLGKVPVLLLEDGTTLFDSRVIVEYLDAVSPVGRLLPDPGRQRIAVKRWEALADGICDAAAAIVFETQRRAPELRSDDWIDRQRDKIERGVAMMAEDLGDRAWCNGESFTLADVATGCALGYLDFRQPDIAWRALYPHLARHAEKLARRPSFTDTAPPV